MPNWFPRSTNSQFEETRISAFDIADPKSEIARRTIGGAAITMASSGLMFLLQILQLAVLSRLLAPEDFGLIGMATVATMFVKLFSDIGLPMATVQRDKIDQEFVTAVFYIDVLLSLGLMALCMVLAPFAAIVFDEPRVTPLIVIIGLTFPLVALRGQHQALLTRNMQFMRLNLVNLIAHVFGAVIAITCAWVAGLGYWAIAAGMIATSISMMVFSWIASPWVPSRPGSLSAGWPAIGFGLNLLAANFAGWLWKQADRALIGWRWDANELGYYARACSVLMVPISLISGPIGSAVIPALSRLQNDEPQRTAMILSTARAFGFCAGLLTVGLAFNAEFIISLILGPQWGYSVTIFSVLALSLFPSFVWEHARIIFISLGRTDTMRNYALAAAATHVLAFSIGVQWGAIGVAIGLAIASFLVTAPLLAVSARVSAIPVLKLANQFTPSFLAMVLVGALIFALGPMFKSEGPLFEAFATSVAILIAFVLVHAAFFPLHEGWRSDLRRIWILAQPFLRHKRSA